MPAWNHPPPDDEEPDDEPEPAAENVADDQRPDPGAVQGEPHGHQAPTQCRHHLGEEPCAECQLTCEHPQVNARDGIRENRDGVDAQQRRRIGRVEDGGDGRSSQSKNPSDRRAKCHASEECGLGCLANEPPPPHQRITQAAVIELQSDVRGECGHPEDSELASVEVSREHDDDDENGHATQPRPGSRPHGAPCSPTCQIGVHRPRP